MIFLEKRTLLTGTGPGGIAVEKGVPWRDGVWKHEIIDGPISRSNLRLQQDSSLPGFGQEVSVRSLASIDYELDVVGEEENSLILNVRFKLHKSGPVDVVVQRTGYRKMANTLWLVNMAQPCLHNYEFMDKIELDLAWKALIDFTDEELARPVSTSRYLYRTVGSTAARWRALVVLLAHPPRAEEQIMLRTSECCFQCAINQTCAQVGRWSLVL